jgi:hypothetical protein
MKCPRGHRSTPQEVGGGAFCRHTFRTASAVPSFLPPPIVRALGDLKQELKDSRVAKNLNWRRVALGGFVGGDVDAGDEEGEEELLESADSASSVSAAPDSTAPGTFLPNSIFRTTYQVREDARAVSPLALEAALEAAVKNKDEFVSADVVDVRGRHVLPLRARYRRGDVVSGCRIAAILSNRQASFEESCDEAFVGDDVTLIFEPPPPPSQSKPLDRIVMPPRQELRVASASSQRNFETFVALVDYCRGGLA